MEDDPAHQLHVEHALVGLAQARLADGGERLEEEILERLAVLQPLPELGRLAAQLVVGELLEVGLERRDVGRLLGEPLDAPALADAQYLLETAEVGAGHRLQGSRCGAGARVPACGSRRSSWASSRPPRSRRQPSADRIVTSPGTVQALARSGYSVAFLSGPTKGHCGPQVRLWNLVNGGVYPLGRHTDAVCNEGPSGGSGVTDIAVAGNRALWLAYAGGNLTDWTLYTATTTKPAERQLEFKEVDAGAPSPIVLGIGVGAGAAVLDRPDRQGADGERREGVHLAGARAGDEHDRVPGPGGRVREGRQVLRPLAGGSGRGDLHVPGRGRAGVRACRGGARRATAARQGRDPQGCLGEDGPAPAAARMLDYAEGFVLYKLGKQIRAAARSSTGRTRSCASGPWRARAQRPVLRRREEGLLDRLGDVHRRGQHSPRAASPRPPRPSRRAGAPGRRRSSPRAAPSARAPGSCRTPARRPPARLRPPSCTVRVTSSPPGSSGSSTTSTRGSRPPTALRSRRSPRPGRRRRRLLDGVASGSTSPPSSTTSVSSASATNRTRSPSTPSASTVTTASHSRARGTPWMPVSIHPGGCGSGSGSPVSPPSRASCSWSGSRRRKSPTSSARSGRSRRRRRR